MVVDLVCGVLYVGLNRTFGGEKTDKKDPGDEEDGSRQDHRGASRSHVPTLFLFMGLLISLVTIKKEISLRNMDN